MSVQQKKFTLVELGIIIGILLLNICIFVPVVMAAKEGIGKTSCTDNLKKIAQINALYQYDNKGYFPNRNGGNKLHGFMELIGYGYLGLKKNKPIYGKGYNLLLEMNVFVCPESGTRHINKNYSYNVWGLLQRIKKDTAVTMPKTTMLSSDLKDGFGGSFSYNCFYNPVNPEWRGWSNKPERHNKTNNVAFVDGHVENVPIDDKTSFKGGTPKRFIGMK